MADATTTTIPPANALGTGAPASPPSASELAAQSAPQQEEQPTLSERARAAVAELQHAMDCNAPVSPALLRELKDLLGVA
ncbi:hypothetical protein ACRAVF_27170 [Bradyrhizobium oligotrophicum S58]